MDAALRDSIKHNIRVIPTCKVSPYNFIEALKVDLEPMVEKHTDLSQVKIFKLHVDIDCVVMFDTKKELEHTKQVLHDCSLQNKDKFVPPITSEAQLTNGAQRLIFKGFRDIVQHVFNMDRLGGNLAVTTTSPSMYPLEERKLYSYEGQDKTILCFALDKCTRIASVLTLPKLNIYTGVPSNPNTEIDGGDILQQITTSWNHPYELSTDTMPTLTRAPVVPQGEGKGKGKGTGTNTDSDTNSKDPRAASGSQADLWAEGKGKNRW